MYTVAYFTTRLYKPFKPEFVHGEKQVYFPKLVHFPKLVIAKLRHTLELSGVFLTLSSAHAAPQISYLRLPGSGAQA